VTGPAAREALAGREPLGEPASRPGFAHASEAEFARILDFYQVEWRYEPHAFPIQWSLDGAVLESFAPDFYLPELDLYVEMTTLRQKLVRKKNRKLRRLRELYPDVRIKLFYARDFRALMLKYGKVALADALSGSEGQFTPANPGPAAEPHPAVAAAPGPARTQGVAPLPEPSLVAVAPSPASPSAIRRSPGPAVASKGRRRERPPTVRTSRTSGPGQGIIGADTPASPAATTRDEGAAR
jgi:hypothetical protein